MTPKPWYESVTLWVALGTLLLVCGDLLLRYKGVAPPGWLEGLLGVLVPLLTAYLRVARTNGPLTLNLPPMPKRIRPSPPKRPGNAV